VCIYIYIYIYIYYYLPVQVTPSTVPVVDASHPSQYTVPIVVTPSKLSWEDDPGALITINGSHLQRVGDDVGENFMEETS
jgi:hypothetical protein